MVRVRMIPSRNRSRPPPRVPPEWRKALRAYALEQEQLASYSREGLAAHFAYCPVEKIVLGMWLDCDA
jgi:hypothetical protein